MNEFIIKKYLDLLPDDTEIIDVSSKNLNYLPNLSRFKKLKKLCCCENKLTSLPDLPENLKVLYCSFNNLNYLPNLLRFKKLEILYCSFNNLTSLPILPENLIDLFCSGNKLTSLPVLPENLKVLLCFHNKLSLLPVLPENLKELSISVNPINNIIPDNNNLNITKKNIKIWNNFRYLYYCLKYRKRFLRIMEPIIKKRYHPSYLYDLKEEDNLDEKLGAW